MWLEDQIYSKCFVKPENEDDQADGAMFQGMPFLLDMMSNFEGSGEGKAHPYAPLSLTVDESVYPSPQKS